MATGETENMKLKVTHEEINANKYANKKPPFVLIVGKTVKDWSHPAMVKVGVGTTGACFLQFRNPAWL